MADDITTEERIWLAEVNLDAIGTLLDIIGPELEALNAIALANAAKPE
jgi:hypothetical protein